jgi:superfamily II DNA or RNA helicase
MIIPHDFQEEAIAAFFNFYSEDRAIINGVPEKKNALICLPTGAGKSIVIGEIIRRMFQMVPTSRVFMGTHVHTLLSQIVLSFKDYGL